MYSWTESPQMREKLTSIIENRFCAAAAPAGRIVRLPSGVIWMTLLESHHSDWMAAPIIASAFHFRPGLGCRARGCYPKNFGSGVEVPDGVHAVEFIPGATVPEVAEVEHGVDHRRSVARLHPPDVHAVDAEDRVGNGNPGVGRIADNHIGEGDVPHTLGGQNVVGGDQTCRVSIIGIRQLVEREITGF